MAKVTIQCAYCGADKIMEFGEYNYWKKRGRENFFCSLSCGAKFSNKDRIKYAPNRKQVCPNCGKEFTTSSQFEVTFCSRKCASQGSITLERRQKMSEGGKLSQQHHPSDVNMTQKILRKREAWKYVDIKKLLDSLHIEHEFEYKIDRYIYDLAIVGTNTIIEFDGNYHTGRDQKIIDSDKQATAESSGWKFHRIKTPDNAVINANLILPYLTDSSIQS